MQVNLKLSWKVLAKVGAVALVIAIVGLLIWERQKPVNIIPWSPAEDSPYICFAAVKGDSVIGISCLQKANTP